MTEYSKFNIVYHLQKWMDSVPGQTFLNYGYAWGASIVILGALFKLTHLPGANFMLYLGMGTEVVVFFLSAFDRPFDKTADGRDLITSTEMKGKTAEDEEVSKTAKGQTGGGQAIFIGGGTSVIGGSAGSGTVAGGTAAGDGISFSPETQQPEAGQVAAVVGGSAWITEQQQMTPEMAEATGSYVEELKKLTEMLGKVNDQSVRLTRDSEEMENLNRTLTGITKVYEMQLKGASQQIGTIDQINEQTRKMAQQIDQLNKIYARMIEAMTVNMKVAAPLSSDITKE